MQGVGFRHHTKVLARHLGLAGWVRNLPDGSVEVWAEGDVPALEELARWLRTGPPGARVEHVELTTHPPESHARFLVLREST